MAFVIFLAFAAGAFLVDWDHAPPYASLAVAVAVVAAYLLSRGGSR